MKTVLVFKTSVNNSEEIDKVKPALNNTMHESEQWNFDLEDCDNILRVEALRSDPKTVIAAMNDVGHFCEELED